jgi:hypothetical protein
MIAVGEGRSPVGVRAADGVVAGSDAPQPAAVTMPMTSAP